MSGIGPIPVRTTIFEFMSAKAAALGAINLGQGFPDASGPASVRAEGARLMLEGPQQYPRMRGTDGLRTALAAFYAETQGLALDPATDIVVTSGGTEAIAATLLALLSPGEAALVIEPAYDAYAPLIRRAGATANFTRLFPPEWRITRAALEAAVTPNTKLILVNDPVNPTGRMLDADERAAVREVALAHDLLIVADEVWEEVRPNSRPHVSLAADPALAGRVVKIGSAGKIFQVTGWKIGWALAPAPLAAKIAATHQFLTFTSSPTLQDAVAFGLNSERAWLTVMRDEIEAGRARLADGLAAAGYVVLPSEATWFLSIDLAASGIALGDVDFCTRIVEQHGIAGIPVSAFFEGEDGPTNVVRFCHAKAPATIDAALERLAAARRALG
ncbi:aminotransferase class I/II-fold pyridoxal phosphate-dependent enzyme [Sandaracinobacter neustonicus]|uniref:Aminotransferase class I/II-fold pyridoxal phosphate-dependent enzyme n=1 Tax=Sandaracinobacter neustonicus TaxID=1715348 RepID=A0A501XLD3_9SPHN|nr:aminotransferase class I/II-fold pyridoxal phosphate-dependent enzyme [Sandaracinobacter neustonicus]TPE61084.1 aminotransferase class I/II-fold pyridoxal phosphate-dependent enzyme [Sandaracinobacter neustonicus]